ncbi:hypothetical protein QTP88_009577 [Uroleucon formosanum]
MSYRSTASNVVVVSLQTYPTFEPVHRCKTKCRPIEKRFFKFVSASRSIYVKVHWQPKSVRLYLCG